MIYNKASCKKQGLTSLQADVPPPGTCAFTRVVDDLSHFPGPRPPNALQGALSGPDTPACQGFPQVGELHFIWNV